MMNHARLVFLGIQCTLQGFLCLEVLAPLAYFCHVRPPPFRAFQGTCFPSCFSTFVSISLDFPPFPPTPFPEFRRFTFHLFLLSPPFLTSTLSSSFTQVVASFTSLDEKMVTFLPNNNSHA